MINGGGDLAEVRGAGNLRRNPQAQQQNRLRQHAEHRFAAGADRRKRATGVQTGNRKEETGNREQVDQGDQIAQSRQRRRDGYHRQRAGNGQHHADHHEGRQAENPAGNIRPDALATQQLEDIPILLQHSRTAAIMQAGAGYAGDAGQQRRGGKQQQRLQ